MIEHDDEPIRGLPGRLPPGERVLWQGTPERATFARTAFHTRAIAIYFAALTALAAGMAVPHAHGPAAFAPTAATAALGVAGVALLHLLAWATARSTLYTITNRRVVLRIGIAVTRCVNLPLALVQNADLRTHPDGSGDLPLRLTGVQPLGYAALWPHARAWRLAQPEPTLRAVPQAAAVATLLARVCAEAQADGAEAQADGAEAQDGMTVRPASAAPAPRLRPRAQPQPVAA